MVNSHYIRIPLSSARLSSVIPAVSLLRNLRYSALSPVWRTGSFFHHYQMRLFIIASRHQNNNRTLQSQTIINNGCYHTIFYQLRWVNHISTAVGLEAHLPKERRMKSCCFPTKYPPHFIMKTTVIHNRPQPHIIIPSPPQFTLYPNSLVLRTSFQCDSLCMTSSAPTVFGLISRIENWKFEAYPEPFSFKSFFNSLLPP